MQEDLAQLNKLINELTKSADSDGLFSIPRVQLLWKKPIVEELKDLEKKVEKLQFFENEIEQSAYYLNQLGKNHIKSLQHKELMDKVEDYYKKIAKYERYILSKIHTEL
ncbi:unnamed protein product [Soboliphyme baturini]|uniref:Intraflagellar transport protein 74 homolog n=1 Tax=Soboliphyme baturini TaxID=241478 RepID=A0A183J7W0_9BILA|nr:unnamed protein product [Soboliphyme baturini]